MGSIHNELNQGRLSIAIKNALGVDRGEPGVERFSETLQPIFNLWERPEWSLLQGERLWIVSPSQNAIAAEFQQVGVRNPIGSGAIVVLEDFLIATTTTNFWQVRVRPVQVPDDIDAHGVVQSRDMRTPSQQGLRTQGLSNSVAGAPVGTFLYQRILSGAAAPMPAYRLDVVLPPGFDILVGTDTVAIPANGTFVTFRGYERTILNTETAIRT